MTLFFLFLLTLSSPGRPGRILFRNQTPQCLLLVQIDFKSPVLSSSPGQMLFRKKKYYICIHMLRNDIGNYAPSALDSPW